MSDDWEYPGCEDSPEGEHCECYWNGKPCCFCGYDEGEVHEEDDEEEPHE
jgi:hypothetical protein